MGATSERMSVFITSIIITYIFLKGKSYLKKSSKYIEKNVYMWYKLISNKVIY